MLVDAVELGGLDRVFVLPARNRRSIQVHIRVSRGDSPSSKQAKRPVVVPINCAGPELSRQRADCPLGKDTSLRRTGGKVSPALANAHANRETWLSEAARLLARDVFAPAGWTVPINVRFSCSWPSRAAFAPKRRRIGEAWSSEAAADGQFGIMISQSVDDPATVVSILAHELVHVTVGLGCGHRGAFKRCAENIGLEGPMTATVAGEAFKRTVAPILEELGPYPHGAIGPVHREDDKRMSTRPKPQQGRMLKAQCRKCGLTLRLTRTWIQNRKLACPDMNCAGHSFPLVIS